MKEIQITIFRNSRILFHSVKPLFPNQVNSALVLDVVEQGRSSTKIVKGGRGKVLKKMLDSMVGRQRKL